jgi:hypothetical protein
MLGESKKRKYRKFLFFSEEKAQLLRSVLSEVESKEAALQIFMSSLSLSEVPKPGLCHWDDIFSTRLLQYFCCKKKSRL